MITSLTKEQEARFAEFVKRWTDIGLSTAPANRPAAEAAVRLAYETAGLPAPKIVWCDSPLSQGLTRAIVLGLKDAEINVGKSVRASVWASVMDSVGASVRDSVWDSGYGQHDANWLGFYEYFKIACGLEKETQKLCGLWGIAENAGWFLPHRHICWISERHNLLKRDAQGRLHCESGPALSYPDGFSIWAIHGVRVAQYVIEEPQKITLRDIASESNAEVRRVKIDRFGQSRYLLESGAKEIHHDDFGTLYRADVPNDEPIVMVKVVNSTPEPDGSYKDYFLRVPPDMERARQAIAWTFEKQEHEYAPCIET